MKRIPLTQGKFAIVDEEDFGQVNQFNWYAWTGKTCKTFYARRNVRLPSGKKSTQLLHAFLMPSGQDVDHRNEDGLDNRRANLRVASPSQNGANRRKLCGRASSLFKGVSLHRLSGKWQAYITFQGVRKYLGLYWAETWAALAYDEAAKQFFGPFANLNFSSPHLSGSENQ